MVRVFVGILAASSTCVSIARAQTVDEVIAKNIRRTVESRSLNPSTRHARPLIYPGLVSRRVMQENKARGRFAKEFSIQGMPRCKPTTVKRAGRSTHLGGRKTELLSARTNLKVLVVCDIDGLPGELQGKGAQGRDIVWHGFGRRHGLLQDQAQHEKWRCALLLPDTIRLELKLEFRRPSAARCKNRKSIMATTKSERGLLSFSVEQAPKGSSSRARSASGE